MAHCSNGLIHLSKYEVSVVNAATVLVTPIGEWTFDGMKQAIVNGLHDIHSRFGQEGLDNAMGDLKSGELMNILKVIASDTYHLYYNGERKLK